MSIFSSVLNKTASALGGRVAAVGTHAELARDCETYRALLGGNEPVLDDGRRLRAATA